MKPLRTLGSLLRKAQKRLFSFPKEDMPASPSLRNPTPSVGIGAQVAESRFGVNNKVGADSYLYRVTLGDFTYCSIRVSMMNTTVGRFCSIGQGAGIGLGRHPTSTMVSSHPAFYSVHAQCGYTFADQEYFSEMGRVTIGNDVWIGANAVILDDVIVGNGAVVAANSVVTENVPDYAIVGGAPARVLKYRFTEEQRARLLDQPWWDRDLEWIQANYKQLHDVEAFTTFLAEERKS